MHRMSNWASRSLPWVGRLGTGGENFVLGNLERTMELSF